MKPITSWTAAEGTVRGLRAAFDAAALSLTVGAEEELMLVTPDGTHLVAGIEDTLLRAGGDDRFRAEFRAAQIELVTRPSLSAADIGRELALARLDLCDALAPSCAAMSSGAGALPASSFTAILHNTVLRSRSRSISVGDGGDPWGTNFHVFRNSSRQAGSSRRSARLPVPV